MPLTGFGSQDAERPAVDVSAIRSRYIKENLRRALNGADCFRAWHTAFQFRRYFHWFADSFNEADRRAIADQLSQLEALCANWREPDRNLSSQNSLGQSSLGQSSLNNDRVGQQFQEAAFN